MVELIFFSGLRDIESLTETLLQITLLSSLAVCSFTSQVGSSTPKGTQDSHGQVFTLNSILAPGLWWGVEGIHVPSISDLLSYLNLSARYNSMRQVCYISPLDLSSLIWVSSKCLSTPLILLLAPRVTTAWVAIMISHLPPYPLWLPWKPIQSQLPESALKNAICSCHSPCKVLR